MEEHKEMDTARFEAVEEMTYATSNAVETLIELLIDKGMLTEAELLEKMDSLAEHEDVEELGHDADAPRDQDDEE